MVKKFVFTFDFTCLLNKRLFNEICQIQADYFYIHMKKDEKCCQSQKCVKARLILEHNNILKTGQVMELGILNSLYRIYEIIQNRSFLFSNLSEL